MNRTESERIAILYLNAKEAVIAEGFGPEIDWQENASLNRIDESTFLRESAWVVLCSGFSEAVLRNRFPAITSAFLHWCNARSIQVSRDQCRTRALSVFGHASKIEAIIQIVDRVADEGMDKIRNEIKRRPADFLQELPFIGPVTSYHLAKNLGLDVTKPDRHLVRMAKRTGFGSVNSMCATISDLIGDKISVIDIVLWRYSILCTTGREEGDHHLPIVQQWDPR